MHNCDKQLRELKSTTKVQQQIIQDLTTLLTDQTTDSPFHQYTVFAGLLPLRWAQHQVTGSPMLTISQHQWAMKRSKWLVQQGYDLWNLRNSQVHADNDELTTTDLLLNQKIDKLYQLQDEVSHYDKKLLQQPIEE